MKIIRGQRAGRFVNAALALLMAFASVVAAAHACTFRDVVAQGFADAASAGIAMPDCEGAPADSGHANACAFHCTSGNLLDVQPAFTAVLSLAQSPLRIEAPDALSGARSARPHALTATAVGPPPLLRFARLLI